MSAPTSKPVGINPLVGETLADTAFMVGGALSCLAELASLAVGHDDGLLLDNRQSYGLQLLLLTCTEALNAYNDNGNGGAS